MTLCTSQREILFGDISASGDVRLNDAGWAIAEEWLRSARMRREIELDDFIVMPNHFHATVFIVSECHHADQLPRSPRGTTPRSLGALIQGFKGATTRRLSEGGSIWQRNFYERVIRNERELDRIRLYVRNNPAQWAQDKNNPANLP